MWRRGRRLRPVAWFMGFIDAVIFFLTDLPVLKWIRKDFMGRIKLKPDYNPKKVM